MSEPTNPAKETEPISSAAELSLYLIMILPDEKERVRYVKDFCRLYDIREKRSYADTGGLQGIGPSAGDSVETLPGETMEQKRERISGLFRKK